MFGIKRRIRLGQFRRAVTIENLVKSGLFAHEAQRRGYGPIPDAPVHPGARQLAAALNYMFTGEIPPEKLTELGELGLMPQSVVDEVERLFASDRDVEKLVARTAYELVFLGALLKNEPLVEQVLGGRPKLLEFSLRFRAKYPELFADVTDSHYRALVAAFAKRYMPEMTAQAAALFQ